MMTIDEQKIFEDRIRKVIEENGDGDKKEGIGYFFDNYVQRHSSPGFDYLLDFAEHYGVSLDWLFGRTDVYSVFGGAHSSASEPLSHGCAATAPLTRGAKGYAPQ